MTDYYEPELGQAVFGAPTAEYQFPEFAEAFLDHICHEIRRVYWNREQREWDEYEDPKIPGIQYRPYYWGDCTCGWDSLDDGHKTEWELRHSADCYRHEYDSLNHKYGATREDKWLAKLKEIYRQRGWDTDKEDWWHGCAVRCDCDYDERWSAVMSKYTDEFGSAGHKEDCELVLPNFSFGPVKIHWYKHRGRGMSCNVSWPTEKWREWFEECLRTVREGERGLVAG